VDYLENKGQWPCSLVSEAKPNIEQLMTGSSEPAAVKGKGPPKGGAAADAVNLDEADMVIADWPENNFFVGDLVE
jgi:hypothetical protein